MTRSRIAWGIVLAWAVYFAAYAYGVTRLYAYITHRIP